MTKINISGLSKEEVILALFKNVYEKSEEAKQTKTAMMRFTPNEHGIYTEIRSDQIEAILRRNTHIDYLGCVKLYMDFSGYVIETDIYDQVHKPGENGVESAATVIEKLRSKKGLKQEYTRPAKAAAASSSSHGSSFTTTMTKTNIEKSIDKTAAEEKLTAFLGNPCRINHLYVNHYVFEFPSAQSYETLQKYADLLASRGLAVVAKAPTALCGGLVMISAKLEFDGSLNDIVAKLDSAPSPTVYSYTLTLTTK